MTEKNTRLPTPRTKKGLYCLETERWSAQNKKDSSTVEPVLSLLRHVESVRYIHKDVATKAELDYYLKQYTLKAFKAYPILYLGFHGFYEEGKAGIVLNERPRHWCITEIEKPMKDKLRGRVVYFGSCEIMKAKEQLEAFRSATQAGAVLGYKKEVSWIESASFDMLVLSYLQQASFNKPGFGKTKRFLEERAGTLYNKLGFELIY